MGYGPERLEAKALLPVMPIDLAGIHLLSVDIDYTVSQIAHQVTLTETITLLVAG